MPLGIPDITKTLLPPKGDDEVWTLNIQEHAAKRAGLHYDIRLSPPDSSKAYSWASKYPLPTHGTKVRVYEQPTHESSYMGFEGTIEEGYGAGTVKSTLLTKVHVIESSPEKIMFNIYEGNDVARYALIRSSGKEWVLSNYTVTDKSKLNKLIPDYKQSYKEIDPDKVSIGDRNQVLAPKVDGAHNTIILRPEKRIDVYSYRKRKNKHTRIDHTYKTDLYKTRSPRELGTTVVRAELYVPGDTEHSAKISGILNSNTWKAREDITQKARPIKSMIFDVVRYKGKHVEDLPYEEKLRMLKEIHTQVPQLELPELAATKGQKLALIDKLKSGKHPTTKEGFVIYDLTSPKPIKAKFKNDYDVLITGVYPAQAGSKYAGNAIGGFIGLPEGSKTPIKIGTGLTDELRRAAYQNPDKFIGNWAKVEGMQEFTTGKLRMPAFKGFRTDRYRSV